jgi:hypothetical protein
MRVRACSVIAFAASLCGLITSTTAQTPQLQLTGGTLSTVNLYSSPPANGTFLSGAGSVFQICTSVACLTDGHLHSGNYFTNATTLDAHYGEYTVSFNTTINTGLAPSWLALHAYPLNYEIVNASNIYKVTTAGTSSAASRIRPADPCRMGYRRAWTAELQCVQQEWIMRWERAGEQLASGREAVRPSGCAGAS